MLIKLKKEKFMKNSKKCYGCNNLVINENFKAEEKYFCSEDCLYSSIFT